MLNFIMNCSICVILSNLSMTVTEEKDITQPIKKIQGR